MKTSARLSAMTDTAVLELAKRIERKRFLLAGNRLLASTVPSDSGQGFLRKMGLGKVDVALGPELTLAKVLKEWRGLDTHYLSLERQYADKTTAEKIAAYFAALNSRISVLESTVFGRNVGRNYPEFKTPGDWLAWRLKLAHPDHRCDDPSSGWRPELYSWAFEESKLSFG